MNNLFNYNVLISTDGWFYAQDGQQYKAVWGKAKVHKAEEILGFNPKRSENWFVVVGEGYDALLIGGCQISYVQICPSPPRCPNILVVDGEAISDIASALEKIGDDT